MAGNTILTEKDRGIINLGISLAAGCQPCVKYHLRKCRKTGWCENEIIEIIDLTEHICTLAYKIMKLRARAIVNSDSYKEKGFHIGCDARRDLLVGLAVSYTVNNTDLTDY
jgi:AhpD family alkylhydroperoxidase